MGEETTNSFSVNKSDKNHKRAAEIVNIISLNRPNTRTEKIYGREKMVYFKWKMTNPPLCVDQSFSQGETLMMTKC